MRARIRCNSKAIENTLRRTAARWRWLRFWQHSAQVGTGVALAVLLIGGAMWLGLMIHESTIRAVYILVGLGGLVAWFVVALVVVGAAPARGWLARGIERVWPSLSDRLNTVIALEGAEPKPEVVSYVDRIEAQAGDILKKRAAPYPFSVNKLLTQAGFFLIALLAVIYFYDRYRPWQHARQLRLARTPTPAPASTPPGLALPETNATEEVKMWGEVRIVDPGRDLRVTKVDAVALQIEAAANQPLRAVDWSTAVNGGDQQPHPLPAPAEPRFAVYQPVLYLDELGLSDWDVVTYYAGASTDRDQRFASDIYFLEVRPFREDILKLPGGENGQAYQCLNELTALIQRQQHIIRQTHKFVQGPPESPKVKQQDRLKLADAEKDMGDAVDHFYAKVASEMENKPIGEMLDHLARAGGVLQTAEGHLRNDQMTEGQKTEQSALAELAAARKAFQKTVSENPSAFDKPPEEEQRPIADLAGQLKQMAEFRNERKAAQEFVQKTIDKQQEIATQAALKPRGEHPKIGVMQQELRENLAEFKRQHPQAFESTEEAFEQAESSMRAAAESLEKRASTARIDTQAALEKTKELGREMSDRNFGEQLAQAYKLKKLLDEKTEQFRKMEQGQDGLKPSELQEAVETAKETTRQLKRVAEEEPTSSAFGPALSEALSNPKKAELDSQLERVGKSSPGQARRETAGAARQGLEKVGEAFARSQPALVQQLEKVDPMKGDQDGFERGIQQLQSLLQQKEANRPLAPEKEQRQRQEALGNLAGGINNQYGNNEQSREMLLLLERELGERATPIDIDFLKKLLAQLETFSLEMRDKGDRKPEETALTRIDPARLPPVYRNRIEQYFKRLSEK